MEGQEEIIEEDYAFPFLEETEYEKAIGQLRLQLNGIMGVFNMHGLGIHIPVAIDEIVRVCEQFGMRVRGVDEPIDIALARREKIIKERMKTMWRK